VNDEERKEGMSFRLLLSVLCITTLLCLVTATPIAHFQTNVPTRREAALRRSAIENPMPEYPKQSLEARHTGVAVVEILADTEGRVERVRVLEAPDPYIEKSVTKAVSAWRFKPLTTGPNTSERTKFDGKLFFYFVIQGGSGRVLFPDEMAQGSRASETRSAEQTVDRSDSSGRGPGVVAPAKVDEITVEELAALGRTNKIVVIDVRDRNTFRVDHLQGSINIPVDELQVRGPQELSGSDLVVVDCTRDEPSRCRLASQVLRRLLISKQAVLVSKR
jgi:TonB family protein